MENAEEGNFPSSPENNVGWGNWLCSIICGIIGAIIGLGFIGVMIWYFVTHFYPICYINKFDIFALKQNPNSSHYNNTIHFEVVLRNDRAWDMGVYYDTLNLTFYYKHNLSSSQLIGNASINPFLQRRLHWQKHRTGNFMARGVGWENVTAPLIFRVELTTSTRFKILWKSKRHHMVVGTDIQVNDRGNLVKRKKLTSNARRVKRSRVELVGILVILFFAHSW